MKIVSDKFFTFIVFLFGFASVFAGAKQEPPVPYSMSEGMPEGPPGDAPINDGIYILLIVAILFGLYIIYSNKRKTETSV
jgi:hypothetical protein